MLITTDYSKRPAAFILFNFGLRGLPQSHHSSSHRYPVTLSGCAANFNPDTNGMLCFPMRISSPLSILYILFLIPMPLCLSVNRNTQTIVNWQCHLVLNHENWFTGYRNGSSSLQQKYYIVCLYFFSIDHLRSGSWDVMEWIRKSWNLIYTFRNFFQRFLAAGICYNFYTYQILCSQKIESYIYLWNCVKFSKLQVIIT